MGNLCCCAARVAPTHIFTAGDLDDISHQLELFFERVVPRTPRGTLDVKRCEREAVRDAVVHANATVAKRYNEAFDAYALRNGATLPVAEKFRTTCTTLTTEFSPSRPLRCALPPDSDVNLLIQLASENGAKLHEVLRQPILTGGAYHPGPRKKAQRIREKARSDYGGDIARVVDVERATGVFDSLDALNSTLLLLRRLTSEGRLTIRRCKDAFFAHKHPSGYRDVKLFVEVSGTGFIGELQLNLRRILQIKDIAHKIYDVERALEDEEALRRAIVGLDIESEQVLRLVTDDAQSVLDAFGSIDALETALTKALPRGCEVANVYIGTGHANVCLGVTDAKALAELRDDIVLGSRFEDALSKQISSGRVRVDRSAFMECYARTMMRFTRLTMHQREKLEAVRNAPVAVLLAPAGGGKTFVAIQRVVEVLNEDDATVLFVARNEALALFFCKWLVVASRKSAEHVVERVHVLVAPFLSGPRRVHVEAAGGRRRLVFGNSRVDATTYALIVVDEAHHLVGDSSLRSELAELGAAESSLLFLGDASQATAAMSRRDVIARSLVRLPLFSRVVVATLSEVVRSTKRIVAGAAAFQLEAGRKAETSTHGASAGPPLVARIFSLSKGDDAGETYAREVVEALAAIRRQLVDLQDLDDRVAVVGPDESFIQRLREPLARALGEFELVDAATTSAVLPRGDTEARDGSKQWLVVDTVENMDGLERLVVICVGLDQVIDRGVGVLETRSRLYRAMTRAQLAVAVVNEALPGGWLEFLGRVELDDKMFDDAAERGNRAETAADDVVGAVVEEALAPVATHGDATAVSKASAGPARGSDGAQKASPNDAVDAPVAEKAAADADVATTPSEAEPMKVLQSIWDASAVETASRGDLQFMPFFDLDPSKLAVLRMLKGHSDQVWGVAVFPDGRRVVSAGGRTLKVWDVATSRCVATLKGHSDECVAVFPDGRRVVSASWDNTLKVWDVETGECVATLEGHSYGVMSVAVFPDGRRVVSGSGDKTLRVWDVATGKCVATLKGHWSDVYSVAVFPDGRRVVSGSYGELKVWDVATGKCVATLEGHSSYGHSSYVKCVAVFPDGRRVVSCGGGDLKVWDMATGKCVATLEGSSTVAVFPDGRRVVSGSSDNTLKVWDVATGKCVATLKGHSSVVSSVAVSPDGRRVVSGSWDKTLKLWGIKKPRIRLLPLARPRRRGAEDDVRPVPRVEEHVRVHAAHVVPAHGPHALVVQEPPPRAVVPDVADVVPKKRGPCDVQVADHRVQPVRLVGARLDTERRQIQRLGEGHDAV